MSVELLCVFVLGIKYDKARVRISVSSTLYHQQINNVVCHFPTVALADMLVFLQS